MKLMRERSFFMSKDGKVLKIPTKRTVMLIFGLIILVAILWAILFQGGIGTSDEKIEFKELSKKEVPSAIEREVIPEYRELERALGCVVDGKVYVIVTRGEKPTAGYNVSISSMTMERTNEGSNLQVTACFEDPAPGVSVEKVSTYPYVVASTTLVNLPDSIELISEYVK